MNLELIFKKALKFHLEGKLKIAEDLYKKIVKKKPDALVALNNLASIQNVKYNYNEAIKILRNVINLKPDYLEAINNNGIALNGIGNHEEAILNYEKALRLKPDFDSAINNLGKCQISLNLLEKASENFEKALKINPSNHKARWNLGFVQLLKGNFKDGWKNYEYRKRIKKNKNLFLADNAKEWFGTNIITNKSIYIYTEQGLGDYIQFSRYLILINKLGAKIILDTPQSLRNIIETIGVDFDYLEKLKTKNYDFYCSIMSLPYIFKTEYRSIPSSVPYLYVNKNKDSFWKVKIKDKKIKNIGLMWSGNKKTGTLLNNRHIPLRKLKTILDLPFNFYSLQINIEENDKKIIKQTKNLFIQKNEIIGFDNTAALINNLDLVISVDTSVAHLAGALGKEVWIFIPFAPDFRWLLNRVDTPWYPTAKLFRQTKLDNWDEVINIVKKKLMLKYQNV